MNTDDILKLKGIRLNDTGNEVENPSSGYDAQMSQPQQQFSNPMYNWETAQQFSGRLTGGVTEELDRRTSDIADYGSSKYDEDIMLNPDADKIQNQRYENQWGITKLGLGVAKGAVTAGTTFIDGTVGFINGLGQGVINMFDDKDETGFLDGLWNNDTHHAMKDVSDVMENTFKIYQSTNNERGPWYSASNLLSGAFIGDTILKNIGFMVGAFYSGSVLTKAALIPKALRAMKASNNVVRSAQMFTGSLTSAVGEASIEAINNSSQWENSEKEALKTKYDNDLILLNAKQNLLSPEEYQAQLDNLNAAYQEGLQKIDRDAIHMGNMDFALQIPILTAENAFGWGKLYASNFASSKFMNSIRKTADGYRGNNLKGAIEGLTNSIDKPIVEGVKRTVARMAGEGPFEEMGQSFVNELSGEVAENDVMSYYKARVNGEAYDDVFASWKSQIANLAQQAPEAFGETYLDADSWEEGFVGAISSVFGMPKFRSARTAEGKWQSPITFEGGIAQDLKDAHKEAGENQQIIDYLKGRLDDPAFLESFEHATAHQAWDYVMQGAARDGNQKKFNDAKVNQMINDLYALQKAGLLDVAKTLIETGSDINISTEAGQRDLDYVKANDKSEVEVPNDPLDPSKGTHKEIFSARGWFDKDGNQIKSDPEIVEDIKSRKDEILKYVKQFEKVTNDLDNDTAGVFSDDQLKELAWLQMRVFDDYDRVGSILHDIQRKNTYNLQDILDNQKANGKLSEEKYNELTEKLNSTLDSLDFKDLTAEKWHKLIKKNPELVDVLNYFGGLSESNFKSKDLYQQFQDIFGLQKDIKQFEKTFNEFKENPGLLRAQIDQVRMDARKKQVDEYAKQKEDELSKANDLNEFASIYNEAQFAFTLFNDDENEINKKWFDDYLNQSSNPKVKEYLSRMRRVDKYYDSYNNAVSKINNNDLSEFSDDEQQLLSSVDLNSEYITTQMAEIFSPLEDGLDFDETKKQIQENITNVLKNPNTTLNKELEVLANHILNKLEQAEKINQSQQTQQPSSQTPKEQVEPKGGSLLYDYDSEGNPISQETKDVQESNELELIPDEAQDIISNARKSIDSITNHLNNDEITEAEKEFKDLEKLLQRLNKYLNVESVKQAISDLVDLSDILKSNINKAKLKLQGQQKQQVTSEQTENPENNLLADVKEEYIDTIENLSNTDIQDILDGNPKSENTKEFVNNVLNRSDELTKNKLISLLEARLATSTTSSDIVIPDDTKNNTNDDTKTFNSTSSVTIESINASENNNDSRNVLVGNVIFKPEGIAKLRTNKQKNHDIIKPEHQFFFNRYNIENFINKGLLVIMANDYKASHDGNNMPIHFIANKQLEDSSSRYPRRQPIFAIEIADVNHFNTLTENKLGTAPELVEIDGKKYYPLGPVYFYKNGNKGYTNLQTLMYKEGILFTDAGSDWNISQYKTELANVFKGKLYTSTEETSEATRPISQTGFNDSETLTFGIKNRTGEVVSPQTTEDIEPLAPNANSRLGSTWLLVRGADGKLYPTATKIARFNSTEYDWRTKDTPVIQKMKELAIIICDSSKPLAERLEAKYLFERILGFPTAIQGRVENPIKITNIDGKDIITIKPRTGFSIPSISGETIEERVESFMDAMSIANYKFNVSISELSGSKLFNTQEEYLQFIIDSDIVFTNLIEPSFTGANFEVYPLNENGEIVKTEIVNIQERNRTDENINTTANTNVQYSLADGSVGAFEYDDAGNPIGELTTEMKKAASDVYTLMYKEYEYEDQGGERHGGIYHKDDTDYYIQLSGSRVYTIYFKNDNNYDKIVKAYNKAREKDSPENKALSEMRDNLNGIGKNGNQGVQDSNINSTVQQGTGLSATLPDEFKNDPMTLMLSRADDDFIRVASMLGGDGYELTDDEIIALLELKKCGLDFNVVSNIDDLNKLRDDAQRCHGGSSFRFKDRRQPTNDNSKQKKEKRIPGMNAKKFEEND